MVYDFEKALHLGQQCYIAEELWKFMRLNIDKRTVTVSLFGSSGQIMKILLIGQKSKKVYFKELSTDEKLSIIARMEGVKTIIMESGESEI